MELHDRETSVSIIGALIEVHRTLRPGLFQSASQRCLARELSLRKFRFEPEVKLPVEYKGIRLETGYRPDFLVEGTVVVEVKAVDALVRSRPRNTGVDISPSEREEGRAFVEIQRASAGRRNRASRTVSEAGRHDLSVFARCLRGELNPRNG